jgi:hypothetical protein
MEVITTSPLTACWRPIREACLIKIRKTRGAPRGSDDAKYLADCDQADKPKNTQHGETADDREGKSALAT